MALAFSRSDRDDDFTKVELTFISKEGCHLCDVALDVVEEVRRQHPFRLAVVKIAEGDVLFPLYSQKIPVGLIDGRIIFTYRVSPRHLIRELRAAAES